MHRKVATGVHLQLFDEQLVDQLMSQDHPRQAVAPMAMLMAGPLEPSRLQQGGRNLSPACCWMRARDGSPGCDYELDLRSPLIFYTKQPLGKTSPLLIFVLRIEYLTTKEEI